MQYRGQCVYYLWLMVCSVLLLLILFKGAIWINIYMHTISFKMVFLSRYVFTSRFSSGRHCSAAVRLPITAALCICSNCRGWCKVANLNISISYSEHTHHCREFNCYSNPLLSFAFFHQIRITCRYLRSAWTLAERLLAALTHNGHNSKLLHHR